MSRQSSEHAPLKSIVRKRSVISGWGVYAAERITKNSRIVQYAGEKVGNTASLARQQAQVEKGHIWCFTINRRWVRDASVGGNIARFINHACKPNCYAQIVGHDIWIRAGRTIEPGEELTYNYYTGGDAGIACRCRPGCKTII